MKGRGLFDGGKRVLVELAVTKLGVLQFSLCAHTRRTFYACIRHSRTVAAMLILVLG